MFTITRDFNKQDFKEVAIYSHQVDGITLEPNCDIEEIRNNVERWLKNNRRIFVVKSGTKIVGYSVAMQSIEGYTLMKVWINKEYRGRDLGRILVSKNEAHAREIGENKIVGKAHYLTASFFDELGYSIENNSTGNFYLFSKKLANS